VETVEQQAEQLRASYDKLKSLLASEREHSSEVSGLLAAERQTAASAHEQCTVLSERLSEMQKTLTDTENRLHAVLYVTFLLSHIYCVLRTVVFDLLIFSCSRPDPQFFQTR